MTVENSFFGKNCFLPLAISFVNPRPGDYNRADQGMTFVAG
jgi:hypothetical protein